MCDAMYAFFGGCLQDVIKAVRLLSGGCHHETMSRTRDRREPKAKKAILYESSKDKSTFLLYQNLTASA